MEWFLYQNSLNLNSSIEEFDGWESSKIERDSQHNPVKYTTRPGRFSMKKRSSSKYTSLETKKLKRNVAVR
ncbi:hypothetical protein AVEN_55304-1 [Araneus ventricosus]|uniref:Uncharacterized protein n=1 Tax=Araneus ventricosus TaxID=182803 RepID=A0A4Y2D718_ARAVE|nr:hypothetical protein AVEN_55304-1 [Araneus ventricosus]